MVSHFWWRCAIPDREGRVRGAVAATVGAALLASVLHSPRALAGLNSTRSSPTAGVTEELDTEHLFGFVEGTDIGRAGEEEMEVDPTSLFGKSTGIYARSGAQVEYKYTAFANFRIAAAATFAYYDITGVAALNDFQGATVQSVSLDARLLLIDRGRAPFGLTASVQPHWGFIDETSGASFNHVGWEALLLADRELVPNRIVGAFNLLFDTDRTRLLPNRMIEQEPTPGVGAALAVQAMPGLWLGGDLRYLRGYQGAALDVFSGQAVFAGPTLYARLAKQAWVSVALDAQVWGGAVGIPGALDLLNFERYQAVVRVGFDF